MKYYSQKLIGIIAAAVTVAVAGCANLTSSGTSTVPGMEAMSASALKSASELYSSLGGATGVNRLAQSFGAKLGINPTVTKYLDAAAIDATAGALANTLALLGGQTIPAGSTDLYSALKANGLDANAVKGVSTALVDAGKEQNLNSEQLGTLRSIMDSVSKTLVTQRGSYEVSQTTTSPTA